ncbi:MAG: SAM-dependent chlorinase/fluorinase [Acidobacteria bacterium]|nr:SAM-dependent chlorinase/fluorinase [Acidobacteriota bacterium]MCZ6747507.1 SAM-dependent chlorinase/fluorinase [Acidobacteriota bacterium]
MKRSGPPIVTLTTDFGLRDAYVAEMKGCILSHCPTAVLVDISHQIPAGDIEEGAFVLARAATSFPPGTVHLAVVDPGVGGTRRALAAESPRFRAVGPDNGLLAPLLDGARVVALDMDGPDGGQPAPTFHGRDLFAPAAARLARGDDLDSLGSVVTDALVPAPAAATPTVLHVDHFGNCVTNIDPRQVPAGGRWHVQAGKQRISLRVRTYSEAPAGEPVLILGSDGRMEIALRDGRAATTLNLARGDRLEVIQQESTPPRREKNS